MVMMHPLIGQLIGKRYQLTRHISEGGYGNVFKAIDTQLDNEVVAVKLLRPPPPDMDPEGYSRLQQRFMDEARVSALLGEHPSIVQVKSYGVHVNTPYLVMEFLSSGPTGGLGLDQILEQERLLPPERVVHLAEQICTALHHAHCFKVDLGKHSIRGVIHRDIKPSNIFVLRDQQTGLDRVKLLDFGISKLISPTKRGLTQSGYFLGTMCYASPEQMRGETLDARSDIYSLGVLLYELLTSQLPFLPKNDSLPGWYHVHNFEAPFPFDRFPQPYPIPSALQEVVLSCLAKNPEGRPNTMKVLSERLTAAFAGSVTSGTQNQQNQKIPFSASVSSRVLTGDATLPPEAVPLINPLQVKPKVNSLEEAIEKIETGDYKEAIHILNRLIQSEPNESRHYAQRGVAHLQQGNWGMAQMDFQGSLRLDPQNEIAQKGLQETQRLLDISVSLPSQTELSQSQESRGLLLAKWVSGNWLGYALGFTGGDLLLQEFSGSSLWLMVLSGAWMGVSVSLLQLIALSSWVRREFWILATLLGSLLSLTIASAVHSTQSDPMGILQVMGTPLGGMGWGVSVGLLQAVSWQKAPIRIGSWTLASAIDSLFAALGVTLLTTHSALDEELLILVAALLNSRIASGAVLTWIQQKPTSQK
jgi:serine/threonine protein kinase